MKDYQKPLMKNSYKKPCLVIEYFAPNESVSSCTCTVTFYGDYLSSAYYDENGDGYYTSNEKFTNLGTSRTTTIDIQQNKNLGYILIAGSDNANDGIEKGELRMRSLTNSTYKFYNAYNNISNHYNNTGICGVLGTDGKMYLSNKWGFSSITNQTFS